MRWTASIDPSGDACHGGYGVDVIADREKHEGAWVRLTCEKDCRFREVSSNWHGLTGMMAGDEIYGKFEVIWLDRGEIWAYRCRESA